MKSIILSSITWNYPYLNKPWAEYFGASGPNLEYFRDKSTYLVLDFGSLPRLTTSKKLNLRLFYLNFLSGTKINQLEMGKIEYFDNSSKLPGSLFFPQMLFLTNFEECPDIVHWLQSTFYEGKTGKKKVCGIQTHDLFDTRNLLNRCPLPH